MLVCVIIIITTPGPLKHPYNAGAAAVMTIENKKTCSHILYIFIFEDAIVSDDAIIIIILVRTRFPTPIFGPSISV